MAFFNELIRNIEQAPAGERSRTPAHLSTVLQYAPRRLRADTAEPASTPETEIAYWRARAYRAEARFVSLEARVRRIATLARRGD